MDALEIANHIRRLGPLSAQEASTIVLAAACGFSAYLHATDQDGIACPASAALDDASLALDEHVDVAPAASNNSRDAAAFARATGAADALRGVF